MTLMMFDQYDNGVRIFTDTLDVSGDHAPRSFQTKVWPFPHWNMVMTVTGTANLADAWHWHLRSLTGWWDIDRIDEIAPTVLAQLWEQLETHHNESLGTATVYLFGFPAGSDRVVRYTYRSMRDFESERVQEIGFGVKPPVQTVELTHPESREDVIALAEAIRAENGDGTAPGTVPIGGDLFATTLQNGLILTEWVHRFDNHDDVAARMTT